MQVVMSLVIFLVPHIAVAIYHIDINKDGQCISYFIPLYKGEAKLARSAAMFRW